VLSKFDLCHSHIIIQLKASLQPNIGFTLRHVLAVFTRSVINLLRVNLFR